MDSQHNVQRDLFIDGYIAQMFGPLDAEAYYVSLLKRGRGHIQWHTSTDITGVFLAAPPPGLVVASYQHDWVIDHVVRDTGPVIPQKIWVPRKASEKVRRVDYEQIQPPIFFIHNNGRDLGLPLIDAASDNCRLLRGAEEAVPVGPYVAHAQIRINWRGYEHLDWNEQTTIRKQTGAASAISLETFAKHVGRKVMKFMETARYETYDGDQRYLIGDNHITPRDIILIGTIQVSQGSWMPILQLNDWKTWMTTTI